MKGSSRRSLVKAFGLSLAAHALVLVGLPEYTPPGSWLASPALHVTVLPSVRPVVSSGFPSVRVLSVPAILRQTTGAENARVAAPLVSPGKRERRPVLRGSSATTASAIDSSKDIGEMTHGLAAEDVRHYRLALAVAARKLRFIPSVGAGESSGSRIEVTVSMESRLAGPRVALSRSSGIALLDQEVLDMMKRAVNAAELPLGMTGQNFRIVMPLLFGLSEIRP